MSGETELGTLRFRVVIRENEHDLTVEHETTLEAGLQEMQCTMTAAEKREALRLRTEASTAVAAFFMYVRNPDRLAALTHVRSELK